jgi:hypothetical protein
MIATASTAREAVALSFGTEPAFLCAFIDCYAERSFSCR